LTGVRSERSPIAALVTELLEEITPECSVVDAEDRVLIRTTATFMRVPNTSPL
jgi:hypothetical protein